MNMKKQLGFFQVFSIATGAMISSGIFILPGLAFARTGPSVFVSYALAGIVALTSVFSICEMTSAMPKSGGDYFFITRSIGIPVGIISGFMSWLALSLKSAFAMVGIAEVLAGVFGLDPVMIALGSCLFFIILNLVGVREAAGLQALLVAGLIAIMIIYIIAGLPRISMSRFEPFAPSGFNSVIATTGFVFVAYGGLLKVASVSEEVRDPTRNIPLALLSSLFVTIILYLFILIVTVGVMDPKALSSSLTPIADGAAVIMGKTGFIILSVASFLAFITTANAGIMSASRYPLAMSRDQLLPGFIGKTPGKRGTPVWSILLTGILIGVFLLVDIGFLVKAASTFLILNYILSNLALIILRESRIHNYRPSFRSPLYPWVQLAGIICFAFLISDMGLTTVITSSVVITIALILYFTFGRKKADRESALLTVISRITDKKIASANLEEELKEILYEHDSISVDRFDLLVANAAILDIESPTDSGAFFAEAADKLHLTAALPKEEILRLLIERERDGSTAISPFIAIPHIVVPGTGRFTLLLARCRGGISFNEEHDSVKAAFILLGSKDERNFHLRALSAIAQVVQEEGFEERWLSAKNEQALRDAILLGKRKRD